MTGGTAQMNRTLTVLLMLLPVLLIAKLSTPGTRRGMRRRLSPSMWSVIILVLRMASAIRWAILRLGV